MHQELEWIDAIAPDMIKVLKQRYFVLRQVEWMMPVGRRTLATTLNLSERVMRTETDFLRKQELIVVGTSGMMLTDQGISVLHGLEKVVDNLVGVRQDEQELSRILGIENCLIVSGDSDEQPKVLDAMGKSVSAKLALLLPEGKNLIAVMGGTTMAQVADQLTTRLSIKRDLTFLPARGGVGESVDIQANSISGKMALQTGGNHRALYVPEQLSERTYEPLLEEPSIQEVLSLIKESNAVIHSIGEAMHMAKRRDMSSGIISMLKDDKAVGEAFGYFFDAQGKVVYKIPRIGLQIEDLTHIKCIVAVAGGHSKAEAIVAYMKQLAPKQTWLITDEGAANSILKK
ncbi:sugar-binding transcriptional regulator [Dellaglioa algida]|uniref:sugar-binding transcriptional regulator n=1 Tax=Dellaglioa algida TaxID=105612 RepID=UPI000BCB0884|nr:sugar-binding domain-containing protein [Dellaglioa algida]MDK1718821.1 SorC family transcriptional regulator [Dellaglioa algida]MDK1728256.1 SorC family transcriptional regulator [Dellaglioa algida]MDK1730029.1 SorC family transcriptional regulator [Dellaglioa algida]MDK1735920.1 SorC family transcriptional regulator [Dellaglioa algida]MDK1737618.1 SorC family transcriptional regulator [Dellaglioa algida]